MADQYHVVLADLKMASDAFYGGSKDFAAAVPDGLDRATVDSGDSSLDNAVAAMVAVIDAFRDRMVDALVETSGKLMLVHDNYQRVEGQSVRQLYDNMIEMNPVESR